jgi:long-chain fatty acid transport protein
MRKLLPLLACALLATIIAADAHAGGFALREQSSAGLGSAFAGVAAGGSLSSAFWNPATMTQQSGFSNELVITSIFPYASNKTSDRSTLAAFGGTGDVANDAVVPAGYASWQVNPDLWLGVSINSPFGLAASFPDLWAGRNYGANTTLKTYNATPSVAIRINDWIALGFGVQVQYASASISSGLLPTAGSYAGLSGSGWGYGWAAGITLSPRPETQLGLGWRSAIDQRIEGTLTTAPGLPASTVGSVGVTLALPDIVSFGVRHRVNPNWTLMGTIEWVNWSRIGTAKVYQPSGNAALVAGAPVEFPFRYKDGWFYSMGSQHTLNNQTAIRVGIGYEVSPVTDHVRTPRLPDNDRVWLATGVSHQISSNTTLDIGYGRILVRNTHIDVSAMSGNPWFNGSVTYVGDVKAHVDVLSIGLRYAIPPS